MKKTLKIGVIGDFDKNRPSHIATTNALYHGATVLAQGCRYLLAPHSTF